MVAKGHQTGPQSIKSQGYRKVGDLIANSEQVLQSLLLEILRKCLGKGEQPTKGSAHLGLKPLFTVILS